MSVPKHLQAKKILMIDDAQEMREIIKTILISGGFENVREATNGRNALDILKAGDFDFVLCDWDMPVMNGIELFKAMHQDEKLKDIPFLMVTAVTEGQKVREAITQGVRHYMAKPFTPNILFKKMVSMLEEM